MKTTALVKWIQPFFQISFRKIRSTIRFGERNYLGGKYGDVRLVGNWKGKRITMKSEEN